MAEPLLRISREKHLGFLTLNRPNALNALTLEQLSTMRTQLESWKKDDSLHAIVIQGIGKAFCAGGDVRYIYENRNLNAQLNFFEHEYKLNYELYAYPKPCIALMNGITFGGGVGISLHGSHRVASENFMFAMPETSIGFFPDVGASYLLTPLPSGIGLYLGMTGARLSAVDSCALHLVDHFVPSHKFPYLVQQLLVTDLSENAHFRVTNCIAKISEQFSVAPILKLAERINQCFSPKSLEEIFWQLSRLGDPWSLDTQKILLEKSPLSLHVTLLQLQRAQGLSLRECLNMDYGLMSNFMQDFDFYEGVRALLIDKDKQPIWQPRTIKEVTSTKVLSYFALDSSLACI